MLFILILTSRCNSNCRYCGGYDPHLMPEEPEYSIADLQNFISQYDRPSIAFYGGEPLLRTDLIMKIIDCVDAEHFILQTNGLLLNRLPGEYIREFSTILISFDGRKDVHNYYRRGTYDRVLENARNVSRQFDGELIARMVASSETDIYLDVMHILSLDVFTHVHWQIDAVWSRYRWNFEEWVGRYNAGVRKLVNFWIDELQRDRLHNIVPFLGVVSALRRGYQSPPCASGYESFAITTDGRILACPVCPDLEWNNLGDIFSGFRRGVNILEPCPNCNYFRFCGGRCLFFNRERLWGQRGFELVCSTVRNLVDSILARKDEISCEIAYPEFLNTTEIIP
ncbi:TIGR04084 family radical SAM/SPASM domain-containing protein [Archaeoglobus neptunius]|uniref:TIGR04084 family radical SAM/SPASM domain-containing protein n=1 Tax=Archaeoglobus neptunius TaxID=2798580 RepID=UPI0019265B0C